MIYLTKGQPLLDNPGMVVYDQTGYYNDGDSIICAPISTPDEPACRFEAKFIAYGGMVYSISDPDALLEEVKKMDPNTLIGKDSKQIAIDTAVSKIVTKKPGALDTATSTTPVLDTNTISTSTPPLDLSTSTPSTNFATSTPPLDLSTSTPQTNFSTTTPPLDLSTSTPPLDVSTSTPPIDLSTTTPTTTFSTTTPPLDISTSTPPQLDISTSTPVDTLITPTPTSTPPSAAPTDTSTSSEVVAFAKDYVKKRISKRLGL